MDNTFRIYPIGIQNFEQLRNNNVYVDKTELKMQDAIYVFEFKVDGTPEEAITIHVRYICGGMGTEICSSFFYC